MATNINRVYQKVLAIANKEQRGYITPQEFNLFADKAQMEIYNNYFHGIKMSDRKPKNQMDYSDELEMIEEKLHPFYVDEEVTLSTSQTPNLTLPINMHKLINITLNGNEVTQVNKHEIAYTQSHPLLKANTNRSVFVREDNNIVTIHPAPTTTTTFEVSFYKRPATPNWTYVVVSGKALYNGSASDAQDFELHASEEENLVNRILMLAGVTIKQPDVYQAGMADIQLTKQQQNS